MIKEVIWGLYISMQNSDLKLPKFKHFSSQCEQNSLVKETI